MTSRSSFSNYFRQGPKRFLWAFSLSGLLFFLCIFVPTMMVLQVDSQNPEKTNVVRASEINMVIGTDNFATPVVLLLLAVIMGVVTFNYLHNKSKVDLFHSLPISRGKLFFTEYFWAIVSILTGFFLFWGLSCGLVCLYGYESLILWREVLPMVLSLVVYFLTTFGLTVIGVVLCGHTVISLMMVVVLLGGPVAFALVTAWAQDQFLNTYIGMSDNVLYLSPVTSYFAQYLGDMSAPFVTVFYGVFSILLFVTGYLLYRFRPSESCGSSLSFPIIKGMLEVFVGCISAIGFGLLFYNLISTLPWMFFGILLGGTLIHIFAQVSFEFTFPAIFKKKHYLLSVVLMSSLFMVALVYDLRGFDRMTLDESDIQSYRIHCGSDVIGDVFGNTVQDAEYLTENTDLMAELIALGAQPYAEDWSTEELYKSGSYWVTVQVKTGPFSSFERCYVIENTEQSTALLQEIVWSDENVTNNLIFNRYPDAVLEYSSLYLWTDEYYSLTDTQCVQITQALHADYEGYDPTAAGDVLASFSANLQTGNSYSYFNILLTDQFTNTLQMLDSFGIDVDVAIQPEQILTMDMELDFEFEDALYYEGLTVTEENREAVASLLDLMIPSGMAYELGVYSEDYLIVTLLVDVNQDTLQTDADVEVSDSMTEDTRYFCVPYTDEVQALLQQIT